MLESLWYSKNLLAYCLAPISGCFRSVVSLRRFLYRTHFKKVHYFSVPIIVIGNITVGGTGKTPLVIWLANFLKERGYRPGIVSRGHGSKANSYPNWVTQNSDPSQVGDEPLLIARRTECPVMIDPNRPRAVEELLKRTDCNIVISDDGLQHYAMDRDIEIAVIDGERNFGNGFCLPAGPLREPVSRLKQVEFIILNKMNGNASCIPYKAQRNTGSLLKNAQYFMNYHPENFLQLKNSKQIKPSDYFQNKNLHAIAGIGNPKRFFNLLRSMNLTFTEHAFPDHHPYKPTDFNFDADSMILMTEKDAVKCEKFADERFWYLPITADLPKEFGDQLVASVKV